MKQRLLVAGVGVPALLALLLACPAWATMLLTCAVAGIAAYELLHTIGGETPLHIYVITVGCAVLTELACHLELDTVCCFLHCAAVMLLFFAAVRAYGTERPISFYTLATAVMGGIIFPMLYSGLIFLRMQRPFGKLYILMPFVVAFIGDTASMLAGMWFGKNSKKMAPHVSPKKTWVGAVAGPIGSTLGMAILAWIGVRVWGYAPQWPALIAVSVAANILGQLGDLAMSLIKREVGVKDYSHLFLTHGGMLDRFDSTMFITPVLCFAVMGGLL